MAACDQVLGIEALKQTHYRSRRGSRRLVDLLLIIVEMLIVIAAVVVVVVVAAVVVVVVVVVVVSDDVGHWHNDDVGQVKVKGKTESLMDRA